MAHRLQSGLTLLEALIALLVLALLLGTAVPALSNATEAARRGGALASLGGSLLDAVRHATLTGSEVVLCPGDAGGCRRSVDWSKGWIAYADLDHDRQRDPHETLLAAVAPLPGRVHLRSTPGRTRLVFQPGGGNAGSNVTFTLCDGRGPAHATTVVLANDGRLRQGTPSAAAAEACMVPM
ncbi:GspH/FimT family protein [Vulcaniibacterium gelatinicum]|uniref:GspH/FimT family protein n=1 Tax=Vulcaniibacterium gelatinicum TaxID=2598725 RepID=UPI0015F2DEC0|nr:GspH/FimT family protein [Vulcaniibacterium gelatinicum]